jgi:hypothetical protein
MKAQLYLELLEKLLGAFSGTRLPALEAGKNAVALDRK